MITPFIKQHGLSFDLQISGSNGGQFSVVEFTLQEKLSELFTLTLSVVSDNPSHELSPFLLEKASLYVYSNGIRQRRIEGVITTFERGQTGVRRTFYKIVIRPSLWLLTLRQNSRIFHKQTTPQIMNTLFSEHGLAYDCRLEDEHREREYTVQKRETDYDFVSRLAAEEGITIWTQNLKGEPEQTFYADGWQGLTRCCAIEYNVHPQNNAQGDYVYDLTFAAAMTPQHMVGKDNTYLNPDYPFTHQAKGRDTIGNARLYSHYDSYGRFHFPAGPTGDNFARYRLEQLQINSEMGKAKSNSIKIRLGGYMKLSGHPDPKMNRDWQIIEAVHTGKLPQNMEEDSDSSGAQLTNEFTFMYAGKHYRAPYRPKPTADGIETAVVSGPEGEEIFTNELGQVLVHFHWNLRDKADDKVSCWVRVAQGWNGDRYGFYAIPRIGQEVIISYLNGDIDKPIITGCVYNEKHKPPLKLPGNKTQTIFKSKMHKGQGFSQFIFDDTTRQIGTRLQSTHGAAQLNMGYLVHPRNKDGMGEHRGDGFELRTDEWGAIRAGKGLYISTDKREKATSHQLDLAEAIEALQNALKIAQELAKSANIAKTTVPKVDAQQHQLEAVFTDLKASGLLSHSASGTAFTSSRSTQLSANHHVTVTSGKNTDISAAEHITASAAQSVSLLAVKEEMNLIANQGALALQAQHNTLDVIAEKTVKIISTQDKVEIAAQKELLLTCGEAFIKLKDGKIEFGGIGMAEFKMTGITVAAPKTLSYSMPSFTKAEPDVTLKKKVFFLFSE